MIRKISQAISRKSIGIPDLILLTVLLLALFIWLGEGFTTDDLRFQAIGTDVAYMAQADDRLQSIVLDSGRGRVLTLNAEGEVASVLTTDSGAFYSGEKVFPDPEDDSFYVQSVNWDESGYLLESETIVHVSAKGKTLGTVLTVPYEPQDEVNKHRVFDPRFLSDGALYYIYADDTAVEQRRLEEDGTSVTVARWDYADAWVYLQNFAQRSPGEIYAVDKTGQILCLSETGITVAYRSPAGSGEVLYYADVTSDGRIYYTDIYNKKICTVEEDGTSRCVFDAAQCYPDALPVTEGNLSTVTVTETAQGCTFATALDNCIVVFNEEGEILLQSGSFSLSGSLKLRSTGIALLFALLILCGAFLAVRCAVYLIVTLPQKSTLARFEMVLVPLMLVLAVGVGFGILSPFSVTYNSSTTQNLENLAIIGASRFDASWLDAIQGEEDFMNPEYTAMSDLLHDLTTDGHDYLSRFGAEVDRIDSDGRAYSIIYTDNSIGVYYPIDAVSAADTQAVYDSGEPSSSDPTLASGGTFLYGRAPIRDEDGNVVAVMTVAQDNYRVSAAFRKTLQDLCLTVALAIVAGIFILNEAFALLREKDSPESWARVDGSECRLPVGLLRISAFAVSFVLNMTSSFLSVYTSGFWSESLGISQAMAGALPLFANSIFVAVSALAVPRLHEKLGFRVTSLSGVACACAGDLLAGLSRSYPSIVLALLLNGLGFGILLNSVSLTIGHLEKEKSASAFTNFNAGCVAGINSGMIIGSFLAGMIEYHQVFYITSALWATLVFLFLAVSRRLPKRFSAQKEAAASGTGRKNPRRMPPVLILRALCMVLPYAALGGFMYYYIPIFTNSLGDSEVYCSALILIYAVCGIVLGNSLSQTIWEKAGKFSVWGALLLGLIAWVAIAASGSILLTAVAMLVLGISFSFGVNVYLFAFLKETEAYGVEEPAAMSVYNFFNSMGGTVSSVVCGAMLGAGLMLGVNVFSALAVLALLLSEFLLRMAQGNRKNRKEGIA